MICESKEMDSKIDSSCMGGHDSLDWLRAVWSVSVVHMLKLRWKNKFGDFELVFIDGWQVI